jgi:hypothetical protein
MAFGDLRTFRRCFPVSFSTWTDGNVTTSLYSVLYANSRIMSLKQTAFHSEHEGSCSLINYGSHFSGPDCFTHLSNKHTLLCDTDVLISDGLKAAPHNETLYFWAGLNCCDDILCSSCGKA